MFKLISKSKEITIMKRFIAIVLIAALACSPVFSFEAKATDGQDVEEQADSWRYSNGQTICEDDENAQLGSQSSDGQIEADALEAMGVNQYQQGIDVSYWQKNIDWKKVKDAGVDFAIIRCGYGSNKSENDDSYFLKNVKGCQDNGIAYGVYFYSYASSVAAAQDEAAHTIRLLTGMHPDLPVYYDLEDKTVEKAGNAAIRQIAQAYCSMIQSAGYDAGVYANLNWWKNKIGSSADSYDKWIAQWNSSCTYGGNYSVWQYTSDAKFSGISGRVDANWNVSGLKNIEATDNIVRFDLTSKAGPSSQYDDSLSTFNSGETVSVTGIQGCFARVSDGTWINTGCLASPDLPKGFEDEGGKKVLKSYDQRTLTNQWFKEGQNLYYVGSEGTVLTGLQKINGQDYYLGTDGIAQSNRTVSVSGRTYLLGWNGLLKKNVITNSGGYKYGFGSDGAMACSTWAWIGCNQYYFDGAGRAYLNYSKAKKKVAVYRNPGSSKAGTIKKNRKFYVMRTSGKWSQMNSGLWIKTSYTKKLAVYPNVKPSVNKRYTTKMKKKYGGYTGPSTSYIKKKTYKKNKKVTVTGWYGSWAKLSTGYWVPRSKLR